jgi:hypothetical protein
MCNSDLTISMPATCTAWYLVNGDMDPAEARATALQEVDEHASGHAPLTTGSRVAPSAGSRVGSPCPAWGRCDSWRQRGGTAAGGLGQGDRLRPRRQLVPRPEHAQHLLVGEPGRPR